MEMWEDQSNNEAKEIGNGDVPFDRGREETHTPGDGESRERSGRPVLFPHEEPLAKTKRRKQTEQSLKATKKLTNPSVSGERGRSWPLNGPDIKLVIR